MKSATDAFKIVLLLTVAVGVFLNRWDQNSRHDEDQRDAKRAREILQEFYLRSTDYELKRDAWMLKAFPDYIAKQGTLEWKKQAQIFAKAKENQEQVEKLKALRSEHQELTWKHPTWAFMLEYTPNAKSLFGED